MLHRKWLHCYFNNGRYIVIKNYLTLFHFCYEINEFSYSVLYCISLHELISLQELKCYNECVVLMRVCLEYLRRSLFTRGGIRLEQTVIFLRNVMIFLKVPVGMRKILCGNVPQSPSYGVYNISQLIRYARASTLYDDFLSRSCRLTSKLLRQGYERFKLISAFKKFYGRHKILVDRYKVSVTHIISDLFLETLYRS